MDNNQYFYEVTFTTEHVGNCDNNYYKRTTKEVQCYDIPDDEFKYICKNALKVLRYDGKLSYQYGDFILDAIQRRFRKMGHVKRKEYGCTNPDCGTILEFESVKVCEKINLKLSQHKFT